MSVTILVCACGQRMRAPGATPGRGGRCPSCGAMVRVPEPEPVDVDATRPPASGYDMGQDWGGEPTPASMPPPPPRPERSRRPIKESPTGMGSGPTAWWPPSLLYPLRGGDSLGVIAVTSLGLWVFATLIPEYCLSLMADGAKLGASAMGALVALISILPSLAVVPMLLFYLMQYLARVLVAGAEGDGRPPRPPDRNFEGLLQGLSPWFVWLLLGVALPLSPLAFLALFRGGEGPIHPGLVAGLVCLGFPYALMAWMLSILHDDALAASPPAVVGSILRLGSSFGGLCLTVATVVGLGVLGFALILAGRDGFYWLYVVASPLGWAILIWALVVAASTMGVYYHRRRKVLKWRTKRARWGVS